MSDTTDSPATKRLDPQVIGAAAAVGMLAIMVLAYIWPRSSEVGPIHQANTVFNLDAPDVEIAAVEEQAFQANGIETQLEADTPIQTIQSPTEQPQQQPATTENRELNRSQMRASSQHTNVWTFFEPLPASSADSPDRLPRRVEFEAPSLSDNSEPPQ